MISAQRAAFSPSDELRQRRKNKTQQVRRNLSPLDRVDVDCLVHNVSTYFVLFKHTEETEQAVAQEVHYLKM